jgi:Tfp pilus assembly protein PilF
VLFLLAQTSVAEASSPVFDRAVQMYKAHQFGPALTAFQAFIRTNPSDAMSHYYMALCYQGTNQMSLARQQYEWVSTNSPNAQLRSFAAAGLGQLGKYKTTYAGAGPAPSVASASTPAVPTVKISGRLKVIEFYTDW